VGARTEQVERVRVGAVGEQRGDEREVAALDGGAERRLARLEQLVRVGALLEQQRRQLAVARVDRLSDARRVRRTLRRLRAAPRLLLGHVRGGEAHAHARRLAGGGARVQVRAAGVPRRIGRVEERPVRAQAEAHRSRAWAGGQHGVRDVSHHLAAVRALDLGLHRPA